MTYTIRMTGNEVRLVLRALGRYGSIKQSDDAKELALRIEQEFKRQRDKHGNNEQDRRSEGPNER